MLGHHMHHSNEQLIDYFELIFMLLLFTSSVVTYLLAVKKSNRHYKKWPRKRTILWLSGVLITASVFIGPLAERAHTDFRAHMLGHLLIGMLAPLLLALSAPWTLLMRTLPVKLARQISRFLKSQPVLILSNPLTASILSVGGLWVLYTTDLYRLMQQNSILHVLIHVHVLLAGYLFTVSFIYVDPTPHRTSYVYRMIVFIMASAGHGILSKYIYTHAPTHVLKSEAESGGMLMYYGGDAIELILITLFCYQWYRASRPRILNITKPSIT